MQNDQPNVVFLIFDTLRPDFLSCYGGQVETPTLETLAQRGTLFEQAYTVAPGTPVSHAAMFSGQYPSETGVVGQTDIPRDIPLIASWLRDAGYDTFGIPGPSRMGSEWGYDRGFDKYFEIYAGDKPDYTSIEFLRTLFSDSQLRRPLFDDFIRTLRAGTDSMTSFKFDLLLETIDRELSPPFFGMMNTTLVHTPYDPPRPFKEKATPKLQRPRWYILDYLFDHDETLNRDDVRPERIYNVQTSDGIARYLADPDYLTEAELDVLRAWYRASVEYLDTQLSSFVTQLDNNGHLENTILILTADHGEHFGEHGLIAHSHFLYKESLHVPLIITGPGVPSTRCNDLVSLADLFDTICDLASVPAPDETSGVSAFDERTRTAVYSEYGIRHRKQTGHRKYMSEEQLEAFGVGRKCIRTENYTYEYTSAGTEALYSRPDERKVNNPDEEVLTDHRERLFQTLGSEFESTQKEDELGEDIEDNLRKLGYIE